MYHHQNYIRLDKMFTPKEYILIDIANSAGYDKATYEARLQTALGIVENVVDGSKTIDETCDIFNGEDPHQLHNAIKAYMDDDFDHVVGLDAVNQALQLYGALTSDLETASLASLGINRRTDAYQILADELNKNIGTDVFTRNNCKKSLMVSLYGSSQAQNEILSAMKLSDEVALAQLIGLNEGSYYDDWFEQEFQLALSAVAPKAVEAMQVLQDLNDKDIGTYSWVMPDGFKVKYDVKSNVDFEFKRTTKKGTSFTFNTKREIYKASEYNRGMSPNIIHSIDGYVARQVARKMGDRYITLVHDEFKSKVKDCAWTQQAYLEVMVELVKSDLLNNIIKQINPNAYGITKSGTLTEELIMQSSYAIS